jgi:hypothetical protein
MKFFNKLTTQQQRKYKTLLKKLIYRPGIGIPRAKWLKELELEEELSKAIRFTERNIGKC